MKKDLIAALLILSVVAVNAKEKETKVTDKEAGVTMMMLSGSIADEVSGESLVGVEVKIEGTDLKIYTDFDGNFSFKNVKAGEYKLISNYISYKKSTKLLKVSPNQNEIEIKLQSSN